MSPNDTPAPTAPSGEAQTGTALTQIAQALGSLELQIRHHLDAEWTPELDATTQGAHDALTVISVEMDRLSTERARMERERDEWKANAQAAVENYAYAIEGEQNERERVSRLTSELAAREAQVEGMTVRIHDAEGKCERLTSELDRVRGALERIKGSVCGERNPRWTNDWATTNTRGWIADVCDVALGGLSTPDATTRSQ